MKKIVKICSASILALTLGLTVSACKKKNSNNNTTNNTKVTTKTNVSNTDKPTKTTKEALKSAEKGHFIINFVDEDGSIIDSLSVKEGEMPAIPNDPNKESDNMYDYTFNGWDKEIKVATKNETYRATYTSTFINYTVTFKDYDGTEITNNYHYNDTITVPENPTRDHYSFVGWSLEENGEVENIDTVTKSVTYYASYSIDKHTYTFYGEDGVSVIKSELIDYGTAIIAPDDPTKEANQQFTYTFDGWYTEISDGTKVTTFGAIEGDISYFARFSSTTNSYTITWLNDDDSLIDTTTVNYGVKPTHSNPTKAATQQYTYTFSGWSPAISNVTGDTTYKATYSKTTNKYTYTFYNGSRVVKTQTVDYGTSIVKPTSNPTKESDSEYTYTFDGWYTASTGGTKVTSFGTISGNVNYYARFISFQKQYTVTYYLYDGGPVHRSYTGEWGTSIATPSQPTRSGYTFNGWSSAVVNTIPKYNVSIYGKWTAQSYSLKVSVSSDYYYDIKYTGVTNTTYQAGSTVNLQIASKTPTYTIKWSVNGTVYSGDSISFTMPSQATTVTISAIPYTVISSTKIQMGTFPQTKVSLTDEIKAKAHVNWTNLVIDTNYWTRMSDYTLVDSTSEVWYTDIDMDNDGNYDYRGVIIKKYRQYDLTKECGADNSWQDNSKYTTGNFYFFKYEPITWIVSLNDSGKQYMYAEKVLDGSYFYPSTETGQFAHNGGTAYATTYRYSNLYSYMVNTFPYCLKSAQSALLIGVPSSNTTAKFAVAENSTVSSTYVMGTNSKRQAKATDYARCIGVYANSDGYADYWTSSPTGTGAATVVIVDEDGSLKAEYPYRICGIRPFIAFDTTKVTL